MRKAVSTLFTVCICLLAAVMFVACNEKEDESNMSKSPYCEDCDAVKPSYCVNYKTDKEAFYCFDCYWENHWFEKNVTQISYDKWWE